LIRYRHRQPAMLFHRHFGCFTGHLMKHRGHWYFFGDVCRDIKGRLDSIRKQGYKLINP
jgi:hypothetical protein